MLHVLLAYARGGGVDARWSVIEGDERFFALTKRIHNHLYGTTGDRGPLGPDEHAHYEAVLAANAANAAELSDLIRPGDVVILHDPQTAGLTKAVRGCGATVIWRCHVGSDTVTAESAAGWDFLRPYLESAAADAYVFSRSAFAPDWLPADAVHVIPPSIDPFSAKSRPLPPEQALHILQAVGIVGGSPGGAGGSGAPRFRRSDGSEGLVEHGCDVIRTGAPPPPEAPLVVQVSRWDRLKDMAGVLEGFARLVDGRGDEAAGAHLVLAGPVVTAVADDPEGAEVLLECWEAWRALPHRARQRVQLVCVPMADREENALIINALQQHAAVVVQKSLAEGFGLTVSEAMYKRRPVVGSAVGGIVDQVVDGDTGLLLADPTDLDAFARAVATCSADPARAARMGERGRQLVIERFLPDTHLIRWADLLASLR